MKKPTLGTAYGAVERVIPRAVLSRMKKTPAYRWAASAARRHLKRDNIPSWQAISAGPLKGRWLYVHPSGEWQQEMLSGSYDGFFVDFVDRLDLRGKTVFDIGAHIGLHSLYFAERAGPEGRVIAFEPNPANVERIAMHLERNPDIGKRVSVLNKAISDQAGRTDFIFSDIVDDGSSCGGFVAGADTFFEKGSYEESRGFRRAQVETATLDGLIASGACPAPALVKIDIEGAEYLALQGAETLLSKHRPILLIEIHSALNMRKAREILEKHGYAIETLKEDRDDRCFIAARPVHPAPAK